MDTFKRMRAEVLLSSLNSEMRADLLELVREQEQESDERMRKAAEALHGRLGGRRGKTEI